MEIKTIEKSLFSDGASRSSTDRLFSSVIYNIFYMVIQVSTRKRMSFSDFRMKPENNSTPRVKSNTIHWLLDSAIKTPKDSRPGAFTTRYSNSHDISSLNFSNSIVRCLLTILDLSQPLLPSVSIYVFNSALNRNWNITVGNEIENFIRSDKENEWKV